MTFFCLLRPPASGAVMLALALCATAASAQSRYDDDRYNNRYDNNRYGHGYNRGEDCHFYAKDQAYRYAPPGAGALSGAARGGVGGAVFGGIVGGGRGARRGAMAGAALGVIANGARNQADRDYAYRRAFDDCMSGYRR